MGRAKALSIKMIKKVIEDRGFNFEKDFVSKLTEKEKENTGKLAVGWVDIPTEKKVV